MEFQTDYINPIPELVQALHSCPESQALVNTVTHLYGDIVIQLASKHKTDWSAVSNLSTGVITLQQELSLSDMLAGILFELVNLSRSQELISGTNLLMQEFGELRSQNQELIHMRQIPLKSSTEFWAEGKERLEQEGDTMFIDIIAQCKKSSTWFQDLKSYDHQSRDQRLCELEKLGHTELYRDWARTQLSTEEKTWDTYLSVQEQELKLNACMDKYPQLYAHPL